MGTGAISELPVIEVMTPVELTENEAMVDLGGLTAAEMMTDPAVLTVSTGVAA